MLIYVTDAAWAAYFCPNLAVSEVRTRAWPPLFFFMFETKLRQSFKPKHRVGVMQLLLL